MAQTAQLTIYIKIKLHHLTVLGFWGPQNPLECFSSYYNYLFKMTNSLANTNTKLVNIINGIKKDEGVSIVAVAVLRVEFAPAGQRRGP